MTKKETLQEKRKDKLSAFLLQKGEKGATIKEMAEHLYDKGLINVDEVEGCGINNNLLCPTTEKRMFQAIHSTLSYMKENNIMTIYYSETCDGDKKYYVDKVKGGKLVRKELKKIRLYRIIMEVQNEKEQQTIAFQNIKRYHSAAATLSSAKRFTALPGTDHRIIDSNLKIEEYVKKINNERNKLELIFQEGKKLADEEVKIRKAAQNINDKELDKYSRE